MASDAQQSGPLPGSTFTLGRWRQIFGQESAIVGDTNGSAFDLALPPSTDVAEVGSATVESVVLVGGMPLIIPAGETQSIEIPASSNAAIGRTDIIAAQYNPSTFNTSPGPVRLVRIEGTEGSETLPTFSEPLTRPLWAVTRRQGKSLNEAAKRDLRQWAGRHHLVAATASLPGGATLGSTALRDGVAYRFAMSGSSPTWIRESPVRTLLTGGQVTEGSAFPGWITDSACRLDADGFWVKVHIEVEKNGSLIVADSTGAIPGHTDIVTVKPAWKPPVVVSMSGYVENDGGNRRDAGARILTNGRVVFTSTQPGAGVRRVVLDAFYSMGA